MSEGKQTVTTTFDFSDFIAERTRDFTGREWLFAEIDQWLAQEDGPAVVILTGEPGIGKSAIAAQLIRTRPVSASHFCIARRADTLDPFDFVRSLSAQLSQLNGFNDAIIREADVHVDVRQKAERVEGEMVGVQIIGDLVLNAPSAAAAFNRTVVAPLRAVTSQDRDAPLLVVVDGLDEALQFPGRENIVHLLAGAVLPPGARLLLTTRPETGVLDHFEQAQVPVRLIDAGQEENMDDARRHVRERAVASKRLQARLSGADVAIEDFAARAAEASAGNFLYLSWLLPAVESGEQSPADEAEFPASLDGVYREFLRMRAVGREQRDWRTLYRPVLGVLAAAEEPLTAAQVARFSDLSEQDAADALLDVGQFMEPAARAEGRYQLYHQSLVDFLGSRERAGRFWIDLPAVHGRIADLYLEKVARNWSRADDYGLRYLPRHLQAAGKMEALRELLLDYRWLHAKLVATDVAALLADIETLAEREDDLQLLYEALRLSAYVLIRDPAQLPAQLWGRLQERPEEALSALLAQVVEKQKEPWLRPLRPTLEPPGGSLVHTLPGHTDTVTAVTVTPAGRRAISGSSDRKLKVWDLEDGRELRAMGGHTGSVRAVAVTPDGHRAVSASSDWTLKIWDLESGRELRTLDGHGDWVNALTITPDGRQAISASDDGTLKVWDLESGREMGDLVGHGGRVNSVAVTPDGRRAISASSDWTLKLWNLEDGRELRSLEGHVGRVNAVTLTPDGRRAVSASCDKVLKVWDMESGRTLRTLAGHGDWVTAVAVTSDGRRAVSASSDETLKVWDLKSGRELQTLEGHIGAVNAVVLTLDGRRAIFASVDRTLKVWDLERRGEFHGPIGHDGPVTAVAVTPDGQWIVSASTDRTLKVWDPESKRALRTIKGHIDAVNSVAVTPDGRRAVSASSDNALKVWDMENGRELRKLAGHGDRVTSVAVTPDGHAVSTSSDATLKIWDLRTGRMLRTLAGHNDEVWAVAVTPDGRLAVSGSSDTTLKVWDLESGRELRSLEEHSSWITAVAVMPHGQWVVSASIDGTLKVWNLETGRAFWTLREHRGAVTAVAVTPDGWRAVSASSDRTLKLWSLEPGEQVITSTGDNFMTACAVLPDGRTFIAGDASGQVHFLRLEGIDQAEERGND